jgi:hypothetical protein
MNMQLFVEGLGRSASAPTYLPELRNEFSEAIGFAGRELPQMGVDRVLADD